MKVIELDASKSGKQEMINGVVFHVAVSPYFFPDSLECDYDSETGCLSIKFVYPDKEEGEKSRASDGMVTLFLGKNTGKLLSVDIDVDQHELNKIKMLVTDEVPEAIKRASKARSDLADIFEAAGNAIKENADSIAETAVPA